MFSNHSALVVAKNQVCNFHLSHSFRIRKLTKLGASLTLNVALFKGLAMAGVFIRGYSGIVFEGAEGRSRSPHASLLVRYAKFWGTLSSPSRL